MEANSAQETRTYTPQQYQRLINAVISILDEPKHPTAVSKMYSNDKNQELQIQAYAKISGRSWTYYVKDLEVMIGRNTYPESVSIGDPTNTELASSGTTIMPADIDLGPAKVVSRNHACIRFNMQRGIWELHVLGRNGARVNFQRILRSSTPYPLSSGTTLDIGGTQMMFILPDQKTYISQHSFDYFIPKLATEYGPVSRNRKNKRGKAVGHNEDDNSNTSEDDDDDALLNDLISQIAFIKPQDNTSQIDNRATSIQQRMRTFEVDNAVVAKGTKSKVQAPSENAGKLQKDYSAKGSSSGSEHRKKGKANYSISHREPSIIATEFPQSLEFSSDLSSDENKNIKPPHSYATMITQAILSSPGGVISLADIYKYISTNYAYYRFASTGWQNSIRHNLSLNKAFEKVPRKPNEPGKGMKWRISEEYQKDFLKKWNSGKIAKVIRRGSSVSRQLQLHMSKYNCLPLQVQDKSGDIDLDIEESKPNNQVSTDSNATESGQRKSTFRTFATVPTSARSHLTVQPSLQKSTGQIANLRFSSLEQPKVPVVEPRLHSGPKLNGSNADTIASAGISGHPMIPSLSSRSSTQIPGTAQLNTLPLSNDIPHLSPIHDTLLHSPTKSFHITAMEAYTPERGVGQTSKSPLGSRLLIPSSSKILPVAGQADALQTNMPIGVSDKTRLSPYSNGSIFQNLNSRSPNVRSSPNVWNLLQFTSATNTPAVDKSGNKLAQSNDLGSSPLRRPNDNIKGNKELMLNTEGAKITSIKK